MIGWNVEIAVIKIMGCICSAGRWRAIAYPAAATAIRGARRLKAIETTSFENANRRISDAAGQMPFDDVVEIAEARLAFNMIGRNAMDAGIETAEIVARINQRFIFEGDLPAAECDDPDLADAADASAGSLNIDQHEIRNFSIIRRRGTESIELCVERICAVGAGAEHNAIIAANSRVSKRTGCLPFASSCTASVGSCAVRSPALTTPLRRSICWGAFMSRCGGDS